MRPFRVIAALLAIYTVLMVVKDIVRGSTENIWWVSHAVLFLAIAGFFLTSNLLLSASLVLIFVPHTFWILDYVLLLSGLPTFGITDYLLQADLPGHLLTMHHLFLMPLLAWGIWKQKRVSRHAWALAAGVFAFLTLGAALFTPPEFNVNCAFRVCDIPLTGVFSFLNELPLLFYWIAETAVVTVLFLIPTNSLLDRIMRL